MFLAEKLLGLTSISQFKIDDLKGFLRSKGLAVGGRKADLVERASEWFSSHQ